MSIKPFRRDSEDTRQPVFDQPWQAQALALADLLIQNQHITAQQWSETLGAHLKLTQTDQDDQKQSQENYYQAVIATLQALTASNDLISSQQLSHREQQWRDAYLTTPHGQPVKLENV